MREHEEIAQSFQSIQDDHITPAALGPVLENLADVQETISTVFGEGSPEVVSAEGLMRACVIKCGIDQTVVSNEGFSDLLRKVKYAVQGRDEHGVKAADKKPGTTNSGESPWYKPETKKAKVELINSIKRFYLNPTWIDKQELVTGTIPAKDFSAAFSLDGKAATDPFDSLSKAATKTNSFISAWNGHLKSCDVKMQEIDKKTKQLVKAAGEDSAKIEEIVSKAAAELMKIADSVNKAGPKLQGSLIAGYEIEPDKWGRLQLVKSNPAATDVLPALDKEGIKKAAELIVKCLDDSNPLFSFLERFAWLDHSDGDEFNDVVDEHASYEYDKYYQAGYYQAVNERFDGIRKIGYELNFIVAFALEKWIDRSIK